MSEYLRARRGEESDGFFCRFTFGQFFALLILEVITLFFVFYLGARYGREFLGFEKGAAVAASDEVAPAASGQDEAKVMTTADPEAAQIARDLISKAQTPELKDRISRMFESAKGSGLAPAEVAPKGPIVIGRNLEELPKAATADDRALAEKGPEVITGVKAAPEELPQRPAGPPQEPLDERAIRPEDKATAAQAMRQADAESTAGASDKSVVRVKSAENGRYAVQVGSYPQMGEATRTVEKWKAKGYSAYVVIADIPDRGRWYRVRLGGFGSRDEAQRYLQEFQSRENVEALIVMNEQ